MASRILDIVDDYEIQIYQLNILYLDNLKFTKSVSGVYVKGLRENGLEVVNFNVEKNLAGYLSVIRHIKNNRLKYNLIMIGYGNPMLVVAAKLASRKPVVYNALCSVYERLIVARALASRISLKAFYYWFIDFMAFNLADLVMLESDGQIHYCNRLFFVSKDKCFRAWTGVDDAEFFYNPAISKKKDFTVVFRGLLMPEAGAEYVIMAAKKLENSGINFIMISSGQEMPKIAKLIDELKPVNLRLVTDFLSRSELNEIMQSSNLSLGQLSNHERLNRTIPHKAYESLAMRLPYLTAENKGILELLRGGDTCITCKIADADSLAQKILWAKNNPNDIERIAQNGYDLYKKELTPRVLGSRIYKRMLELFN